MSLLQVSLFLLIFKIDPNFDNNISAGIEVATVDRYVIASLEKLRLTVFILCHISTGFSDKLHRSFFKYRYNSDLISVQYFLSCFEALICDDYRID